MAWLTCCWDVGQESLKPRREERREEKSFKRLPPNRYTKHIIDITQTITEHIVVVKCPFSKRLYNICSAQFLLFLAICSDNSLPKINEEFVPVCHYTVSLLLELW